jgi:flagellin-like hook-associated protein FlgL
MHFSSAETNTAAAISRIQDTDIALKQMELAKENILQQIDLAMLSQTQNAPGNFLTLFK